MPPFILAAVKSPIFWVLGSQCLFTFGDLLARANMRSGGFQLANFCSWWFAIYFTVRQFAMFGQLYVFSHFELGKTSALFGAFSIVLSNALGLLLLGEALSPLAYLAVALAIAAFSILAFS